MKKVCFIICFTVLMSGEMMGQNDQFVELSELAIEHFKCSITKLNFKYYGLSSADMLERLKVGDAVIHYGVRLNDLQRYNEEKDPNSIIQEMGYVTVGLVNPENKRIETFVMLNGQDGKYGTTGIGKDPLTLNYLEVSRKMERGQRTRLVRIPGLNLAYVAVKGEEGLNLIPLMDSKQRGGEPLPASRVFAELAKKVSKGEDVPR